MAVFVNEDDIAAGYEDVRNDDTDTTWALFGYESEGNGKKIEFRGSGTNYDELLSCMEDDQRLYAYVRFETGDEMSRRAKFAFITWIGPGVSALKKGKVSTDKAFVKKIVVVSCSACAAWEREHFYQIWSCVLCTPDVCYVGYFITELWQRDSGRREE
jgi:hypothetical protein